MERFAQSLTELVIETATNLPADVRRGLARAMRRETPGGRSAFALGAIALNVDRASDRHAPICQDTGTPVFSVKAPVGFDQLAFSEAVSEAVVEATRRGALRPNSVSSLTGRNSGDNLGPGMPEVTFEQWLSDDVEVRLLLKGGGSENQSAQYSLPCMLPFLGRAERDLEGVRKCILHAIHEAQGQGCSAGIVGVAIGGDRASGHQMAKEQMFRTLDDMNPDPLLRRLEARVVEEANLLGIGTMGFGGRTTLMGCKIEALNRLPASFFVTVSYGCWALRRLGAVLDARTGEIRSWLYKDTPALRLAAETGMPTSGREIRLTTPLSEDDVLGLSVGDVVLLSGLVHTGRDALHQYLMEHDSPASLRGGVLYHCGPVAVKNAGAWTVTAAGPTTSIREEPYAADVIRTTGLRAMIGKGGMGRQTLAALEECGAVYLNAIGGAAQLYAERIEAVEGVDLLELGVPEAMWHLRIRDFPVIVTMDAHGHSLHDDIEDASAQELLRLKQPLTVWGEPLVHELADVVRRHPRT